MELQAKNAVRIVSELSSRFQQAVNGSNPNGLTMACAVFVIIYSLYSWSPLMRAGWSIIDDHEIVATIGTRARLPLSEVPKAAADTEAGSIASNRYRPVYYSLRIFEMAIWGNNPQLWFAFRIVLGIASFALLAICSVRLAGPILGTGFVVFELLQTYWADIYTRLGPAEVFAFFGACLVAWQAFAKDGAWSLQRYLSICAGVILAIGSKENFIFMALVPAWLLWAKWHELPALAKAGLSTVLAFAAWIVVVVIRGVAKAGQDVYANDVSAVGRFRLLSGFLARHDVQLWLIGCAVLFYLWHWLRTAQLNSDASRRDKSREVFGLACLMTGLLIIYASQYVFYSGKWPEKALGRYLVPGLVAAHFAVLVGLATLARLVEEVAPRWTMAAHVAGALLMVASVAHKWNGNHARAADTAKVTSNFTKKIATAAAYLKMHPEIPIIVNSHSVIDYEPVQALSRFLRASGVDNKIGLHIDGYASTSAAAAESPLVLQLTQQLEAQRDRGSKDFRPLSSLDKTLGCFSFGLSGAPASQCAQGDRIWR